MASSAEGISPAIDRANADIFRELAIAKECEKGLGDHLAMRERIHLHPRQRFRGDWAEPMIYP